MKRYFLGVIGYEGESTLSLSILDEKELKEIAEEFESVYDYLCNHPWESWHEVLPTKENIQTLKRLAKELERD